MERALKAVLLIGVVVMMGFAEAEAGYGVCNTDTDKLKPCMPAVTDPPADPVETCCEVLKDPSMNLTCFCQFGLTHPLLLGGLGIKPELAEALPGKCNIPPPPGCS